MKKEEYTRFRWFFTSRGFLAFGGKNAVQNEAVIQRHVDRPDFVCHTEEPGSPFVVVKEWSLLDKHIGKTDLREAAAFCACFSRAWRACKKEAAVGVFRPEQILKKKGLPTGTFLVRGEREIVKPKLRLYLTKQRGVVRCVPFKPLPPQPCYAVLVPGKLRKEKAVELLARRFRLPKKELLSALPAGGFKILQV